MLQESNITSNFLNDVGSNGSEFPMSTFDEQLRRLEQMSKSVFCKSSARSGSGNATVTTVYYAKEDYVARTVDQLSLFKGDRVKAIDDSNGPNVLVSVAGETGVVPSSVLTLKPAEFTDSTPLLLAEPTKKTVRFKDEHEEIPLSYDKLAFSSRVSSVDDLPGIMIATGVPPKDPSQLLRVYAGNSGQVLGGGYRTLLANESDTIEQLTMRAVQRFRLTLDPFTTRAYLTLENVDTHHSLLLPDPSVTTLGTVIELAKRATWMQSPVPKESNSGFKRLAKKIAKFQDGRKPNWLQTDNRSISSDSSGEQVVSDQPSPLGITRDPSSDFETGYKFYLNLGKLDEV